MFGMAILGLALLCVAVLGVAIHRNCTVQASNSLAGFDFVPVVAQA